MNNIIQNKKYLIVIIGSIVILMSCLVYYLIMDNEEIIEEDISLNITTTSTKLNNEKKFVDVKGSVVNPGVYEFEENDRVIDAIELAGGLTKNANTSNINLSQKLTSEMVIYVYSNSEIKNSNETLSCDTICKPNVIEVNNCISSNNSSSNTLININTANISELTTISGIGESKAKSIIEYRETNGKFNSIEDLKNISGIGESLFEKIKDKITV